jgi:heme-degrading monooxygenase HmoA
MFGTLGRAKVKPEDRGKLVDILRRQSYEASVEGFLGARVLLPRGHDDEVWLAVWFTDEDSYYRNADDPKQHERWQEYSALFQGDAEWIDGEWLDFAE